MSLRLSFLGISFCFQGFFIIIIRTYCYTGTDVKYAQVVIGLMLIYNICSPQGDL